ncbi:Glyceraldehyde-3-phosphate dehydrogenase 2, partial [Gonioctena quinquepunctata]
IAFRVPVASVSVLDLTARICQSAKYETIKQEVRKAAEGPLRGTLGYTEEEVVSTDFLGSHCISIFDANAGRSLNDNFVKLVSWYDNETGYATKLVELIKFIQEKDCEAAEKEKEDKQCQTTETKKVPPPSPKTDTKKALPSQETDIKKALSSQKTDDKSSCKDKK